MFANVEGMRIYYERSDGKGTPVVLMHGWGCSVDVMRRVYDRLSRLDKTVIAFDFPGFGRSDCRTARFPYTTTRESRRGCLPRSG